MRVVILALGWMLACGDSQTPPEPPTLGMRDLPAQIAPPIAPSVDAGAPREPDPLPAQTCCEVRFAVFDDDGSDALEETAVLRGVYAPLDAEEGMPLTFEMGVWSTTVCMPPSYEGTYYYEYELASDLGEGVFVETRYNPNAPLAMDPLRGTVNFFTAASDCGADFGAHSDLGE